jgi:hypothetical protein
MVPALKAGMEFGQLYFAVLAVFFLTWVIYRAFIRFVALLGGRAISLVSLLPTTMVGWLIAALVVLVLYLGWSKFGPEQGTLSETMSSLWDTVSEYSPFGALTDVFTNDKVGDLNATPESENSASDGENPTDDATLLSKPGRTVVDDTSFKKLKADAEWLGQPLQYHVEEDGRNKYNVFPDGTETKVVKGRKCWAQVPLPHTDSCDVSVACLNGKNPLTNTQQRGCPHLGNNL